MSKSFKHFVEEENYSKGAKKLQHRKDRRKHQTFKIMMELDNKEMLSDHELFEKIVKRNC